MGDITPRYKRVLIKISGEALAGEKHFGLDFDIIKSVCSVIKKCVNAGVEIGLVVGGGNFWRGLQRRQREDGTHKGRLHGHDGHGYELPGCGRRNGAA